MYVYGNTRAEIIWLHQRIFIIQINYSQCTLLYIPCVVCAYSGMNYIIRRNIPETIARSIAKLCARYG